MRKLKLIDIQALIKACRLQSDGAGPELQSAAVSGPHVVSQLRWRLTSLKMSQGAVHSSVRRGVRRD